MAYTPPGETRQRILDWMRERLTAGEPPTVREVQRAFGFKSVQSARAHLEALVAAGALEKTAGRSRSYRLPAGVRAVNHAHRGRVSMRKFSESPFGSLATAVKP